MLKRHGKVCDGKDRPNGKNVFIKILTGELVGIRICVGNDDDLF